MKHFNTHRKVYHRNMAQMQRQACRDYSLQTQVGAENHGEWRGKKWALAERGGRKDMERDKGTGWASLTNHLSELLDLMWCTPLHANMHVCALLLLHVRTHTNRFIKQLLKVYKETFILLQLTSLISQTFKTIITGEFQWQYLNKFIADNFKCRYYEKFHSKSNKWQPQWHMIIISTLQEAEG